MVPWIFSPDGPMYRLIPIPVWAQDFMAASRLGTEFNVYWNPQRLQMHFFFKSPNVICGDYILTFDILTYHHRPHDCWCATPWLLVIYYIPMNHYRLIPQCSGSASCVFSKVNYHESWLSSPFNDHFFFVWKKGTYPHIPGLYNHHFPLFNGY